MAENTNIEWATHTFNPWYGCQKVGPGCDNCYAEGWGKRSGLVKWGPGEERRRSTKGTWKSPLKWNRKAEIDHNAWERFKTKVPYLGRLTDKQLITEGFIKPERPRVFCVSIGDVFDNAVPQAWRDELWSLIKATPYLYWLRVTKRIGNAKSMLPADWGDGYPNVWLGATICNQEEADRDIPKLLETPAAVRWLSMEPLLGPVDLTAIHHTSGYGCSPCDGCGTDVYINALNGSSNCASACDGPVFNRIDWVVVGGESGHNARPMHPDWAKSLQQQCEAAGVPFFFKQWGAWANTGCEAFGKVKGEIRHIRSDGSFWGDDLPEDENADVLTIVKVGKKAAGRLLYGREFNEYPRV